MVREGSQHAGEIGHAGAAAAELFRHAGCKHLAGFQLRIIFGDEGIRLVVLRHSGREAASKLIREIRDSKDTQIILCSHLLRDVEDCCDEVMILKDGRLVTYCNLEAERQTNRKFIQMETRGEPRSFLSRVEALGCELAMNGSRKLKMILPEAVEVRDLYQIAAETGVQIRRLDFKRDSLQDIFLKAMEGSNGRP